MPGKSAKFIRNLRSAPVSLVFLRATDRALKGRLRRWAGTAPASTLQNIADAMARSQRLDLLPRAWSTMMKFSTTLACIVGAIALMPFAGSAPAQPAYPSKPIRCIVPYAAGGGVSVVARMIGQKLSESWGQPVIIDNRPSANGIIGTEAAAKSSPDGHTLLFVTGTHVIVPHLLSTSYDAIKDFAPVTTVGRSEFVLAVHPSLAANNLQEFIALAKAKPGQLNYASSGSGSSAHLATELFSIMAGTRMQHVPYKGTGAFIADLIGGQVQLVFSPPLSVYPHIKAGKLKALAVSGESRLPALPLVPTFAEAGLPGYAVRFWNGVLAPIGTPSAIIDKLSAEVATVLRMPDIKEKLSSQGMDPFISTPEQFAAMMQADALKFAKVIEIANIRIEQ